MNLSDFIKIRNGENIPKDAFGHTRLDEINPGQWFAKYFKSELNCDKVLVQKSGYYSRSASPSINNVSEEASNLKSFV